MSLWHFMTSIFVDKYGSGHLRNSTVLSVKSDSDVVFCLQLLSKTLTCTLHLSQCESIDHLCVNPSMRVGLIHT